MSGVERAARYGIVSIERPWLMCKLCSVVGAFALTGVWEVDEDMGWDGIGQINEIAGRSVTRGKLCRYGASEVSVGVGGGMDGWMHR